MQGLAVVPNEPESDGQLDLFEGKVVQRYRLNIGTVPEFACIQDGQPVKLEEGQVVVVQCEAIVTKIAIGAGYKGAIPTKSRDRVHHANVLDGSQVIVHIVR